MKIKNKRNYFVLIIEGVVWTYAANLLFLNYKLGLLAIFLIPAISVFFMYGDWFVRMWFSAAAPAIVVLYLFIFKSGELELMMIYYLGLLLPTWLGSGAGAFLFKKLRPEENTIE